jgi:hypothetical protein
MGVLAGLNYAGFTDEFVLARLREFAFSFPREYARRKSKGRWAEKTAFDAFHIDAIEKFCAGHVHFVGIVRHPLDVAVSCQDFIAATGAYSPEMHAYIQRYPMPLEAHVRSWIDVTDALFKLIERHPESAVLCRYEDLVASPQEIMTMLLEFLGEQYDSAMLEKDMRSTEQLGFGDHKSYQREGIHHDACGRWSELTQWSISYLGALLNPFLERCGYATVPIDAQVLDVDASRRRYAVSLMLHAQRTR